MISRLRARLGLKPEQKTYIFYARTQIYLEPDITDDYKTEEGALNEEGLYSFLCGERAFSRDRVETVVERMRRSQQQKDLTDWMIGGA